jgi:succinylglutamate desuccinylase
LVNPDGVALGHWRHNLDGVDLNRDWGPFSQPETQAVKAFVESHLTRAPLHLMLDFHSTNRSLFYTQPVNMPISLPAFTRDWLNAINDGSVPIRFDDVPGYTKDRGTTKSYYYTQYGVPAITVELGDLEQPQDLTQTGRHMAITMMQQLLSEATPLATPN